MSLFGRKKTNTARQPWSSAASKFMSTPRAKSGRPVGQARLVAIDLETSGLNARRDQILSIGMVDVTAGLLDLASSYYTVTRAAGLDRQIGAQFHGLGHSAVAGGASLKEGLDKVLDRLAGGVMIAHGCQVEQNFLNAACQSIYGVPFKVPIICTLQLEQKRLRRSGRTAAPGGLRLAALRERYGLPRYKAHHALVDAIACGELFLAQFSHISGDLNSPVREFVL